MIISNSRRFIFIHIHKTGGTSIERALDAHLAWNDIILGGSVYGERIQGPYSKRFGLNKHGTLVDVERVCGSAQIEDYFTFALVRNPLSRMCSMYNFVATSLNRWATQQNIPLSEVSRHITPEAAKKKPALKWASSRAFMVAKDFSEFIRHKKLSEAPGFRPQRDSLISSEGELKTEFFRLEDRDSWIAPLGERLGLTLEFPHANESDLKLIDAGSVSARDREYIEALFDEDYKTFGYSKGG
jgi:hypothetical protein